MSRLCALIGAWRTLIAGLSVSGHDFDQPTYRFTGSIEYETLACARCGYLSEAWS